MSKKTVKTESLISLEHAYELVRAPLLTEKATVATQNRQFVFVVSREATKPQIKAAVEAIFKVKVDAVNTLLLKGKEKRFKGFIGRRSDRKKAYVTLKEGHAIDIGASV